MQIGLGSYSFRWAIGTSHFQPAHPLRPEDLVLRTAELGCTLLQIADSALLDSYSDAALQTLKSVAVEHGVTLEVGTSGATVARLERYLNIAKALDSRLVRLVLDGSDVHPTVDQALNTLRQVAPLYESTGVRLAIENHFLLPSSVLVGLVDRVASPAVGICLDTANSIACQEWPLDTIRQLAFYAFNVHLKDYQIGPHAEGVGVTVTGTPLGEGRQDVMTVLSLILESCPKEPEPNVILEQWLPRQETISATLELEREWTRRNIAAARDYLRRVSQ